MSFDNSVLTVTFLDIEKTKAFVVNEIYARSDELCEVWTKKHFSFLISTTQIPSPLSPLKARFPKRVDREWHSNFDYILWLNRASGRSFHDRSLYPVFPNFMIKLETPAALRQLHQTDFTEPKQLSEITNVVCELQTADYISADYYCLPNSITFSLPSWAATPHEFVYKMRKLLERPCVSRLLPAWIGRVWGPGRPKHAKHQQIFPGTFPQKFPVQIPKRRVSTVSLRLPRLVYGFIDPATLWLVDLRGDVWTGSLLDELLALQRAGSLPQWASSCDFFHSQFSLLLFDRIRNVLFTFQEEHEEHLCVNGRLFQAIEDDFVWCSGPTVISTRKKVVVQSIAPIVAFHVNMTFRKLVYATVEGDLHFVAMMSGRELKNVEYGQVIEGILITPSWGFVVLKTAVQLSVFTIHGELLRTAALESRIMNWAAFTSEEQFDYVVYAMESGEVGFFEAFYPENRTVCHHCHDVVVLEYWRSYFVVVTARGTVEWIKPSICL
jgi:hypothetical protein